jgi:hypothetical protein
LKSDVVGRVQVKAFVVEQLHTAYADLPQQMLDSGTQTNSLYQKNSHFFSLPLLSNLIRQELQSHRHVALKRKALHFAFSCRPIPGALRNLFTGTFRTAERGSRDRTGKRKRGWKEAGRKRKKERELVVVK